MEGGGVTPALASGLCAFERRIGMSASGALTLVVVVAVLFVISLPRLRSFARHENERDARHAAALLARELPSGEGTDAGALLEHLPPGLLRQLPDTELLAGGRVLRRHGYVFTVLRIAPPPPPAGVVLGAGGPPAPVWAVHARPWRKGPTGSLSFVALADGRVYRNENARGSGPERATAEHWNWGGWRQEP